MTSATVVSRQDRDIDPGLRRLCDRLCDQHVAPGAAPVRLSEADLHPFGAFSDALPALIAAADQDDRWDDVVEHFGSQMGQDRTAYVGPMRAREDGPEEFGVFVATTDSVATTISGLVRESLDAVGEQVFGYACRLHGRVVEFVDVDLVGGPLVKAPIAPIAMFTPFFLGGWCDRTRQLRRRRTILFANVVLGRFDQIARQVAKRGITIDGREPRLLTADETTRRSAVAGWLSLHEVMHGSGPAPLFADWTGKMSSPTYGVVEEARVDMTAYLAVDAIGSADLAASVRELILLERVLRSGRRGLLRASTYRGGGRQHLDLDDVHGLTWVGALTEAEALTERDGAIDLNSEATMAAVTTVLGWIYDVEQAAAESDAPADLLTEAGGEFQRQFLEGAWEKSGVVAALKRLGWGLPTSVTLAETLVVDGGSAGSLV